MKLSIFVPLAAFLSFVAAETSEMIVDPDDISSCLNRCLTEAAVVAGCASQFDSDCTCPSTAFKDALATCLKDACTPEDAETAGQLHQDRCGTAPSE
ncbi:uncharacterized protein N7469_003919 [Penicillium citrinum]|uniref:CFEM domain-containing protein n=2 Tax=Penicillium TaxID=5073 RepID=A0A9W9P3G5_PENCI|nr:uncharacterized protein N7469_003919 [Penicillium citrinum]KAJ5234751.1 hypothetical protein N7469_003919 [Penicillium citrinum]KAJ5590371.1 hypothetical protein N7450_004343 [Penicillium hetheringtonii]